MALTPNKTLEKFLAMQTSSPGNLLGTLSLPFLISYVSFHFLYTTSYEIESFSPLFYIRKPRPVEFKQPAKDETAEPKAKVGMIFSPYI